MKIESIKPYQTSFGTYKVNTDKNNFKENELNINSNPYASFDKMQVQTPFLGKRKTLQDYKFMHRMNRNFTPETESVYNTAQNLAKMQASPSLETYHLFMAQLVTYKNFLISLDKGDIKYSDIQRYKTPVSIGREISPNYDIYSDKKSRDKVAKVVDKHILSMRKKYFSQPSKSPIKHVIAPSPSKRMIDDMVEGYDLCANQEETNTFYDSYLMFIARNSSDRTLANEAQDFVFDLKKEFMLDDSIQKKKHHLKLYDDKADISWKNIGAGNSSIILCDSDNKSSYGHFVSSFANLIKKPGQEYKNVDPENTEIVLLNQNANFDFLQALLKDIKTDKTKKDKTVVIVGDLLNLMILSGGAVAVEQCDMLGAEDVKGQPKVRFVFTMTPETYYANTDKDAAFNKVLSEYSLQRIPSINAEDAKKYLTSPNGIAYVNEETKTPYSAAAIATAVDITNSEGGNYPDKTVKLLKEVSAAYPEWKEITPDIIQSFVMEQKQLTEATSNNEQSNFVSDTGKRLSDFVGSPMTKADIESIVRQIKNGTIGTKGFRAYLENGTPYGGGRKYTAEVIAGEAGIPMFTINAENFALKDIDALSQNANLSELKIKKIISDAKAQAQANQHKTAMIFIENFDNFAMNPLLGATSIYERKAFSQLLSEMEKVRQKENINLIVVGSVNNPEYIDPNIMKPYKFLNSIIVYPPQDANERKEVINYYIDKMGIEIEGDNDEEKNEIIQNMAETTQGFTVVDLVYLLGLFKPVADEMGKDKVGNEVFLEAYLQAVSGRTNMAYIPEHKKKITASHEAGHALALQVMYEIAEKQDTPWHLPDKVNFITLDPRGDFGGAMFHKSSDNRNISFEKVMSDIVCSYGGHSAEKNIYNMCGSWGITSDMQNVSAHARTAVLDMGMGKNTGVIHTPRTIMGNADVSEKKKELIEQDIDTIANTGMEISDMIIDEYRDFILEFTEKYYSRVGTGKCTISSREFVDELNLWREKQPEDKKQKLMKLEQDILDKMQKIKA